MSTAIDDRLASSQVVALTGATYRQLDYWATRQFVRPERPTRVPGTIPTSGTMRLWPPSEVAIVRVMVRLLGAGLSLEVAAHLAREAEVGTLYDLGDGIQLRIMPEDT